VGISEWPESVVFLLTGSIPKSEVDHFSIDFDGGCIVVKDSWNVLGGEAILSVTEDE